MGKQKRKPWLAGLLSLIVTGTGQIYNKKYKEGILFLFVGLILGGLLYTPYWGLGLFYFPIWIYAIYDAYRTAKKTITEKPYKNAVWIVVGIFLIIFITSFVAGLLVGYIQFVEKQSELDEYEAVGLRFSIESAEFKNKLDEALLSYNANDMNTVRTKISEVKTILINLRNDYNYICSFQENNLESFPNITASDIEEYKAWLEMYNFCLPKWLDSFYSLTYLVESGKEVETEKDLEDYRESCNSWLNDYNTIRGSCNTIIEINNLEMESFMDYSDICNV